MFGSNFSLGLDRNCAGHVQRLLLFWHVQSQHSGTATFTSGRPCQLACTVMLLCVAVCTQDMLHWPNSSCMLNATVSVLLSSQYTDLLCALLDQVALTTRGFASICVASCENTTGQRACSTAQVACSSNMSYRNVDTRITRSSPNSVQTHLRHILFLSLPSDTCRHMTRTLCRLT